MSNNWLPSSSEDEEQKAQRRRIQKEQRPGMHDVVEKLDAMRRPQAPTDPATQTDMVSAAAEALKKKEMPIFKPEVHPFTPPRQQRTDPKTISERPDPKVISEGYQPKTLHEVEPVYTKQPAPPTRQDDAPDFRLLEIARLWSKLNERDREELLLTAKMKVYLNNRGV